MIKLCFVASDFSSAEYFSPLIKECEKHKKIKLFVIGTKKSFKSFKKTIKNTQHNRFFFKGKYKRFVKSKLKKILREKKPDAILCGISNEKNNLEQLTISFAGNIPVFCFQDFPGDCDYQSRVFGKYYFVLSKKAKEITSKYISPDNIFLVPSPKKLVQNPSYIHKYKLQFKRLNNIPKNIIKFCFVGQPLWKYKGYARSIQKAAEIILKQSKKPFFVYRAHPNEQKKIAYLNIKRILKNKIPFVIDKCLSPLPMIFEADFLFSCFSSLGIDLLNLKNQYSKIKAKLLCLMVDTEIKKIYHKMTGLKTIPFADNKIVFQIWKNKKINLASFQKNTKIKTKKLNSNIACKLIIKKIKEKIKK